MRTEFKVFDTSPLCGKTLEEIEKEFNVKVLGFYNPVIAGDRVREGAMIRIEGDPENLRKALVVDKNEAAV